MDGRTKHPKTPCYDISLKTTEEHCKIPRALANDNFYGFADDTIVKYGVRWIELAAASPILNCIVCYYVEGDRGHLLDENVFQRKNPMNVRGNAYSFAMPWDKIAGKLAQVVEGKVEWSELPQNEELLARTVLFNLRIGNVVSKFATCRRNWRCPKAVHSIGIVSGISYHASCTTHHSSLIVHQSSWIVYH